MKHQTIISYAWRWRLPSVAPGKLSECVTRAVQVDRVTASASCFYRAVHCSICAWWFHVYLYLFCLWGNRSETDLHSEHACLPLLKRCSRLRWFRSRGSASNSFQTALPAGTSLDQGLEECHESPFKCVLVRTCFGKLFHRLETIKRMDGRVCSL